MKRLMSLLLTSLSADPLSDRARAGGHPEADSDD